MELWTSAVEPAELTTFARQSQQQIEAAKGSLAAFFPSEVVDDVSVRYMKGKKGLVDAAEFRAFDAETTIGALEGGQRVTMDLPPVGQKIRIGELDQLRARTLDPSDERVQISVAKATERAVAATDARVEALRGSILESGKLVVNENGFNIDVDLGRSEDMTTTAGTLWGEGGATPLDDLLAWADQYATKNDTMPGTLLVSRKALSALQRSAQILSAIPNSSVTVASVDVVNAILGSYGLPSVQLFDRKVKVGGTVRRVLDENKLFFLPAAGESLGKTTWGRTAEADDPDYAIAPAEGAGIVAAAHKVHDPYSYWARATAIALPVMTDPDASMVATVLK